MSPRLWIHAPNVHTGGGRTLLRELLHSLSADAHGGALLDTRLAEPCEPSAHFLVERFAPRVVSRWAAERRLQQLAQPGDAVLCFGNLPPLLRNRGRVTVFFQNRLLLGDHTLHDLPFTVRARIQVERLWLRMTRHHADEFVVQSETMREGLQRELGDRASIRVAPFAPRPIDSGASFQPANSPHFARRDETEKRPRERQVTNLPHTIGKPHTFDFCYVASGEPHKNHRRLVEAWCWLAERDCFPSLCLTLDERTAPALCRFVQKTSQQHGLRIENRGPLDTDGVHNVYRGSRCLIYPSLFESFGLPLREAAEHGLRVIAAERDYVRDVVDPVATFDPDSPRSIARAVLRELGIAEPRVPVLTGAAFLHDLLRRATASGGSYAPGDAERSTKNYSREVGDVEHSTSLESRHSLVTEHSTLPGA